MNNQEVQQLLYVYSFPAYLGESPCVKIGKTSGKASIPPIDLATRRINSQIGTAHPERPEILAVIPVPVSWLEQSIHEDLKSRGLHMADAPGSEWFRFPGHADLKQFLQSVAEQVESYCLDPDPESWQEYSPSSSKISAMKKMRIAAGLSQSQLANRLGITASAVAKWDQSLLIPTGTPIFFMELCEALGVEFQALRDAQKAYEEAKSK